MAIVHRSQGLELADFDPSQILDEVLGVLGGHWPIFVPASEQERATNDDK